MNRGLRNNNPGNIRPGQHFRNEIGDDGENYAVFATAFDGIRALGVDLLTKMTHAVDTVREIVNVYAPKADHNDVEAYIADVCRRTGFNDDDILNLNHIGELIKLVTAVIFHECGSCPYSDDLIAKACADAIHTVIGAQA